MRDPMTSELRKIRHVLTVILLCLVVIIVLMLPGLFYLALISLIVYGAIMLLLTMSQAFRWSVGQAWMELSSMWRR